MAKQPEPVKVKVIELTGTEFKPGCTYLVGFDVSKIAADDMWMVVGELEEMSGARILAAGTQGDPREAISFFAIPERVESSIQLPPPGHDPDAPGALVGSAS